MPKTNRPEDRSAAAPPTPEEAWRAIVERDRGFDDVFFYGVRTTGIYCRPSCPSRRPRPENVSIYFTREAAEEHGYRACLRCHPDSASGTPTDRRILRALAYLEDHLDERVTLEALARKVGLSPFHLHRSFRRMFGLTPKAYQTGRRLERLKGRLKQGDTVGRAVFEAGFGSTRGVYDRAHSALGMNPSEYGRGGAGREIRFTVLETAFGLLLVAATDVGVAAVLLGDDDARLAHDLRDEFPGARIERDDDGLRDWAQRIVSFLETGHGHIAVPLDLRGSAFQLRVWQALQDIPPGETRSYGEIAARLGEPRGARAVARACATNRAALVVPCHRVIRGDGGISGYRWGTGRKERLLALEASARSEASHRVPPGT
jgi:AraC family transcriptional regulator of adaptative response/methylated-DNA-[protein]-cysteine methyltransferase